MWFLRQMLKIDYKMASIPQKKRIRRKKKTTCYRPFYQKRWNVVVIDTWTWCHGWSTFFCHFVVKIHYGNGKTAKSEALYSCLTEYCVSSFHRFINTHLYYNGSTSNCPDYRGVLISECPSTIAGLTVIPSLLLRNLILSDHFNHEQQGTSWSYFYQHFAIFMAQAILTLTNKLVLT